MNRRIQVHWNGVIDIDGHRPGQWKDVDDGDDYGWEEKAPPAAFVCTAPRDRNYQSGTGNCPSGWYSMFNSCYKFISTMQSYDAHVSGCASAWSGDSKWESYLVSIHDEYENHLAAGLTYDESVQFDQTYAKDGFWIGFKGDAERGWRTEHEEGLPTFTRWAADEPKSITSGNLCAYVDLDGFWHSETCTLTKARFQTY